MTLVACLLLFLSLAAVPLGATDAEFQNPTTDVSDIIERVNANITTKLIHGDIRPSLGRNADPCTASGCKWPKRSGVVTVPYVISDEYTLEEEELIIESLEAFHGRTCIRFVPRRGHRSYLHFFPGTGCWSYLGYQRGPQPVSLRKPGCLYRRTIQHEALHALGFHHEHVRSDRDKYVTIYDHNIQPGKDHNFDKVQTNNLGTPYDFNSVMHYTKYAFSKNGWPTIVAKTNPDRSFGHAYQMSNNDFARVNRLYQC